ncbi:9057_t:CDS:1, partial [Dentiscutata erythropus]
CGDAKGLKLHVKSIGLRHYKSPLDTFKYFPCYDFTLFYCNPTAIISIFEVFKSIGLDFVENFLSIHYILQSKYNELTIPESLVEFEKILEWLIQNNYDIDVKDKLHNHSLYYLLNETRLTIYYPEIILIFLRNGLNPNISLSPDITNLLFYVISRNFPVNFLELILMYRIDLTSKNAERLDFLGYIIKLDKLEMLRWVLCNVPEFKEKQTKVFREFNALQYAMYLNDIEAIKCILECAPVYRDAMIKNDKGLNSLGQFIQFNDLESLRWVLCNIDEFGDKIVEVCEGWNALQYSMNIDNLEAVKCILENAPIYQNPNIKNEIGLNVLGYVIHLNDLKALQWILEFIPEFTSNIIDVCEGWNALQFAMEINNIDAIKCLLEKNASVYRDISIKNSKGFNVLGQMICDSQVEALEWILENITEFEDGIINIFENQYALEYAIINKKWEEMKYILKKAPANKYIPIKNDKGFNFLGQIIFNNHLEILKWILDNIPEFKNNVVEVCDEWNALQFAMNLNHFEAVKCLLEKTSVYRSITIKDIFGLNVICHFIQFNNLEMLQWILNNVPEFTNNTTEKWNSLQFSMDINNPEAVQCLLEKVPLYKDNIIIKDSGGLNILGYAIYNNQLNLLEWILDYIPKFKNEIIKVHEDRNALEAAMDVNNPLVIKCLLEKAHVYQDKNIKNSSERNILGHVIYHNQLELLEWMLKNTPKFGNNIVNVWKNYNALQFAMCQFNTEAIECLLYNTQEYRDVSIRYEGRNVLGHTIYHNQLEALQRILENIPEFKNNIVDVYGGYNALQFAMYQDNMEAAICILDKAHLYRDATIKINEEKIEGLNILGYAIRYNQLEALEWILKNIPQFRNEIIDVCESKNALKYAKCRNNAKAIKCLIENSQTYRDLAIRDEELNIFEWAYKNKRHE